MIKILIADDHPIFREGLRKIIGEIPGMEVTGEACNGQEVLSKLQTDNYDVVLLDISMPGRSGLDVLKQLKTEKPQLPVVILSVYPEEQYAIRSFKAGASAYLTKLEAANELIAALKKVLQGGKYVSSTLAEKMAFILENGTDKPLHEKLSDREYQVLLLIVSGKKTREIAQEMFLSPRTVGTYRMRILAKMNMKSNAELTRYAIMNHLLV
ncbi:MAG: response regulator transcription factor [Acidobacteria bacterium]|nr:response regulator transcription factor [Acidobacteriota bacterium]